jgi:hypothetical protein
MPSHDARRTGELAWRKAALSESGNGIEVAKRNGIVILRDSKRPRGAMIQCSVEELRSFVLSVKAGQLDDLIGTKDDRKNAVQHMGNGSAKSVSEKSAPKNWLDLINRILIRATSSWSSYLMHLVFLVAFFAGLGEIAHAATGISPWVAAAGSLGGGVAASGAAYRRTRRRDGHK